ncbi:MAG: DUF2062 domain-containing protein [Rhodoferax sp.]|nr:DUF2062 domain-containing protein [Rhodoferax sp.]
MTGQPIRLRERLHKLLPTRDTLGAHPWLQPIASRVLDPRLWRFQEEAVARGVAIGAFWAFVIPIAQMPVAVAHCSWWRANIPAAATMTLLTNPLTIGFWLWLAYQLGALVLGDAAAALPDAGGGAAAWLAAMGWPTVLGMGLLAVSSASLGYAGVKLVSRLRVGLRRWLRKLRRQRPGVHA